MHHIGLSHSPFQRNRQILSPTSASFSFSTSLSTSLSTSPLSARVVGEGGDGGLDWWEDLDGEIDVDGDGIDTAEDEKEVLIERLSGLVRRLRGEGEGLKLDRSLWRRVGRDVERIEGVLDEGLKERDWGRGTGRGMRLDEIGRLERESYGGGGDAATTAAGLSPSLSPSPSPSPSPLLNTKNSGRVPRYGNGWATQQSPQWRSRADSDLRQENTIARVQQEEITLSQAMKIAIAAEELAEALGATLAELMARKEESDHIHDLLVTRSSQATERILLLEYRIAEMEDDFSANQSELKFLRIRLQALEAQCSPYIPHDEDDELSESIMNWKIDWEDINRRSRARRGKSGGEVGVAAELREVEVGEETGLGVEGVRRYGGEEVMLRRGFRVVHVAGGDGDGDREVVDVG